MLTLYSQERCPFCRRVVAVLDRLDVEIDIRDIDENEEYAADLVEKGGKRQVPFLVDDAADVAMYESDDIVKYLQTTYGAPNKPRVHGASAGAICIACEG